jgi:hypothetical protein
MFAQSLARSIRATMRRPLLAAMTLATVATSALMPATTPAAAQSAVFATLFENVNYFGRSTTLYANTPDLKTVGFNDMASSLTVPLGTKVALYEHANYLGACTAFTANDPDLRDNFVLNDRVSSVRFGQDCPLQLYDSAGYNGPYRLFWSDVPNLGTHSFDNTVASLRVPPGTKVAAWSDPNYGGLCEEFTADDPDLSNNVIKATRISSIRLGVGCPAQIVLFEHLNYEGAFIKFDYSDTKYGLNPNLDQFKPSWRDRVSSVYVSGGAWVQLYTVDWSCATGECVKYNEVYSDFMTSNPDLRTTPIGEDTADSVHIEIPRP